MRTTGNSRKLQSNVLQLKMLKIPIIMHPYTTNQKKHTPNLYFLNNAIKNRPVVVIIGIQITNDVRFTM